MNNNNYCVIMAGGLGARFWPFSRNDKPKQFLDFFGTGRSLLQLTYDRFNTDSGQPYLSGFDIGTTAGVKAGTSVA